MVKKCCCICKGVFKLSKFPLSSSTKDGYASICQNCKDEIKTQKCKKCNETKILSDYYESPGTLSGYSGTCKACINARKRIKDAENIKERSVKDGKLCCDFCKNVKSVLDFKNDKRSTNGYSSNCLSCIQLRKGKTYLQAKQLLV